jgi:hypothetical protein
MPIAMTDGTTYENSLDMLFAKDMPSREETDRQQKMKDMESTLPPDMRGPPPPEAPTENNQLSEPTYKDQNDPYSWGMGPSMDRIGPAMVPLPEPKFHEIMQGLDEIISPQKIQATPEGDTLPLNARPTSAELPAEEPAPEKSAYQNFTDKLEELSKKLNPSFIPTAEQFRDAPWKEKLGFIIASTFMFAGPGKGPKGNLSNPLESWKEGLAEFDKTEHPVINTLRQAEKDGSQTAANLLGEYRKIDDPTVRAEFSKIIKDKIMSASEGGETSPSNITNPQIDKEDFITRSNGRPYPKNIEQPTRSLTPDSPWGGEPITREDGSTFIGYDKKKLNQLERMWMNGNTYQEIADELNTSRGSVASMAKQMGLKRWDPRGENRTGKGTKDAEFSPEDLARGAGEGSEAGKPWSPAEDKVLKAWYADPNGDLAEIPNMLKHRSEQSIFNRARQKGYDQAPLPDESAKPFVPKGAVSAPEKGSGSGGYEGPVNTELEGKTGISTPNTIPEKTANNNTSLQIDDPVMDAAIDKTWENFGRANRDNLPLISPAIEGKLREMNPAGFKKLKQFELEMDYKYKQPQGRRHWLSDLTPEEADRYRTLYNNVDRIRPVQEQALGDNPREKAIREKNSTYPTTEDAFAARAFDQFHGEDVDSYAKGKVARILGSVDKTGKIIPKAGLTDDLNEFMRGIMKESESKNVDLTKKENWKYADRLADEFTKAAIVSKRVPIAGLGFDPSKVVVDLKMDDIGRSTIGGAYMAPGPEGKGSDATYANFQGAGTMIHESIHRGLEKLRERKDLRGAFANLPADEESLTRYIMYKHAGDPEGDAGNLDAKQRADAIRMFEDTNGKTWARYEEAINKITKAAQDEIKKRRPGGHR